MVPYLLSTEILNQFENTIRERFYGVDRFIQQGRNLFKFKEYIEESGEPIVWINDFRELRVMHGFAVIPHKCRERCAYWAGKSSKEIK